MAKGGTFLSGAKSRLLPVAVPFRYFGTAVAFQLLAWVCVIAGADLLPGFAGGLGWPLAALHAVTLGVLAMTAIGASVQLLPVATRQPIVSTRAPALLWWIYASGVAILVGAMARANVGALGVGAVLVEVGLVAYAALLAHNLRRGRGMPVVAAHGWASLASLIVLLASGASLVLGWHGLPALPRSEGLDLHIAFAAYGFMGLLVMGFSHILVPMFALGDMVEQRPAFAALALAALGLGFAAAAAFELALPATRIAALLCALAALGLHLAQMLRVMRGGMRRELGRSFVLVRVGWAAIAASLVAAAVAWFDLGALPRARAFFVALLVLGLLSFLLGMLTRIVPFLASMHAPPAKRGRPTPGALTAERPLALGYYGHLTASALLLAAIALDSPLLTRIAGATGVIGAGGWAAFVAHAWLRTRAPKLN